jgi:DHA3 family macrolide efflux protein-like MFS transporter
MADTHEEEARTDFKTFGTIWIGQLVSLVGSGLTGFALGIWVLEHTHSVTQFTLTIFFAGLPGIFFGPIAGALVDRWNRRWVMIWSDVGPGLVTLVYAYLLWQGTLEVWHVYIGVVVNAFCGAFQWPAYVSAVTMLVARKDYGRVNGMIEFGQAAVTIAAPGISGFLMLSIGLPAILVIDFATFLFAAGALLLIKIPQPPMSEEGKKAKGSIWKEAAYGWTFIRERPGLFNLLLFFAITNLVGAMCGILVMPMILGFANKAAVGTIMSLVGIGTLIGGLIMASTGGPKPRVYGVLGGGLVMTIAFVLIGIKPNLWLVGIGVVIWYIMNPIINASSQTIWRSKTPADIQGRVFAVRRVIAQFTVPLGDFSAGPVADKIFNPLLIAGGALSASAIARVIGVGPGRGIALLFLTMAAVPALATLWGFLNPRVRNVEAELPDIAPPRRAAPPPEEPKQEEPAGEAAAQA